MTQFRIGVDVGGTFTDIIFLSDDGVLHTCKTSSSTTDYARSILEGIELIRGEHGVATGQIETILHGTTVGSNAILQRRGARVGLITTRGFRDTLEIRNLRIPKLYDISWRKPPPIIERRQRLEVTERIDAAGAVVTPLDEAEVEAAARRLVEIVAVEAIAVCFINAFTNPDHERRTQALIARLFPETPVSISSDVLPEIREYERTSTTVINTYIQPVVSRYIGRLEAGLHDAGLQRPLLLMQSSGGLMSASVAAELPMHIIESGPAGGVIGAQAVSAAIGLGDVISFDMGGTTAKAAIIEGGRITRSQQYEVGGGILTGARLFTGNGYLIKVPAIDLAEVGAGGGSIVHLDTVGGVKVGPESAGSDPGPLCYDAGGTDPTVTDANLILGYINPDFLVGGELKLSATKARAGFAEKIAAPLGLSLEDAAFGAVRIAVSNMMRAVRAVTIERGRDPRSFALFSFGGNGPLFAAAMAEELGIRHIIVPPAAGLFSSFGFLYADVEQHVSRTFRRLLGDTLLGDTMASDLSDAFSQLEASATDRLLGDGFPASRLSIERSLTLRYVGQALELPVPLDGDARCAPDAADLARRFEDEHERTFGHRGPGGGKIEIVTLSVVARAESGGMKVPRSLSPSRRLSSTDGLTRRCYFGAGVGWVEAAIVRREDLARGRAGPLIVEEYDATCLVPTGAEAHLDDHGNIRITLGQR